MSEQVAAFTAQGGKGASTVCSSVPCAMKAQFFWRPPTQSFQSCLRLSSATGANGRLLHQEAPLTI